MSARIRWCRILLSVPLLSLLTVFVLVLAAHSQDAESIAAIAKPSVAAILVHSVNGVASGTGFMIAENRVLTAEHVISNARQIVVKFPQHPAVEARLIAADSEKDVAVLSIPRLGARALPLADMFQVREGQRVIVIGFPRIEALGMESATVTEGIISAIRPGLIQMQAPVSPGNSGGPVLSLKGEVLGIVRGTLRGQQQGVNFAAPISAAKALLTAQPSRIAPSPAAPQSPGVTGNLKLEVASLTSPVFPGAEASIQIQTDPGARCDISVIYMSGPSRASGLGSRTADANGYVTWSWRVGSNTTSGTWPILISCTLGEQTVEIETAFTVR